MLVLVLYAALEDRVGIRVARRAALHLLAQCVDSRLPVHRRPPVQELGLGVDDLDRHDAVDDVG